MASGSALEDVDAEAVDGVAALADSGAGPDVERGPGSAVTAGVDGDIEAAEPAASTPGVPIAVVPGVGVPLYDKAGGGTSAGLGRLAVATPASTCSARLPSARKASSKLMRRSEDGGVRVAVVMAFLPKGSRG